MGWSNHEIVLTNTRFMHELQQISLRPALPEIADSGDRRCDHPMEKEQGRNEGNGALEPPRRERPIQQTDTAGEENAENHVIEIPDVERNVQSMLDEEIARPGHGNERQAERSSCWIAAAFRLSFEKKRGHRSTENHRRHGDENAVW